jgi:hypothetical protein
VALVRWPASALPGYDRIANALEFAKRGYAPHIYAYVAINGKTLRLLLDTGAPGTIKLTPSGVKKSELTTSGRV